MYDTGTICHGNIAVTGHKMSLFVLLCRCLTGTCKQRLIFLVFQILSDISLKDLIGRLPILCKLAKHIVKKCLRHIIGISVCCFYLYIGLIRVYAKSNVGRQRPGCCCPCKEISILTYHFETYHCRTLLDGLIPLCYFMGRKRGSAARAVWHDLKALIQELFVPDLLQSPPFGFNKVIMIGYVRIIHIGPETNRTGEILPHPFIFPDTFLTLGDKRIQTILLNLFLTIQSQQLFHFQFYRKSMGIPACLSRYHISFHGTVPGDHILDDTGKHVTNMGLTVCSGRSVIKSIGRSFLSVFHAFLENVIFAPELFNFFLAIYKV